MNKTEFVQIARSLQAAIPELSIHGKLLFLTPTEHLLCGLNFDSSINQDAFYVTYFAMPLFVPIDHLYYTFGHRLRQASGVDGWKRDAPKVIESLASQIKNEALPFLREVSSLSGFISFARRQAGWEADPNRAQAVAFAHLKMRRYTEAASVLARMLTIPCEYEWQLVLKHRAEGILLILEESENQLRQWEGETVANLRLNKYHSDLSSDLVTR